MDTHKSVNSGPASDLCIPNEVAIETVFGCNLHCDMCFIDQPTERKKGVMPMELFCSIVDDLIPYKESIDKFDLFALGEPMLDPLLNERIKYVKKAGFRNLAISTNADIMTAEKQDALLESGIETVIVSIDGVTKKSHEAIRKGSLFERVVENTESLIRKRDAGNYATRFVIRFIRQDVNYAEWEEYRRNWGERISPDKRDKVTRYDMHNHGGKTGSKKEMVGEKMAAEIESKPCHFIFDILIILANGAVALCTCDFLEAQFDLGTIPPMTPIEAFNSEAFQKIRAAHIAGRKNDVPLCRECSIPYSETGRTNG